MTKELNRHEIREKALQSLFPLDFNLDLTKEDAIQNALMLEQQELVDEEQENFVPTYLDLLVTGVIEKKAELDALIQQNLTKKWTLNRIAKTDLIILRMAIFEMNYVNDEQVPNKVAVNEAVELTKKFSDDASSKFVNGVLSSVLKEINE
ncbi:MAG: transcription antitermination factor NusB [Lactobacillales bacterium]|jgi:N utilization substance protein B|nr:transcription antitermination factor NusB [Lactobacillales bacterium]